MSQFVDECRREWSRLGVPDAVANEMAADLAADLTEAEADGVSAEDVLGSAVFDPRAFAASWASERGVVPPRPVKDRRPPRLRKLTVVGVFTAVVAIVAAVAILTSAPGARAVKVVPAPLAVHVRAPGQVLARVRGVRPPDGVLVGGDVASDDLHRVGWLLLIVGVGGLVLATALSVRVSSRRTAS